MVAVLRLAAVVCLALALHAARAQAPQWPSVATPPAALVQTVASDMVLNGRRSRVIRFDVKGTEKEVLSFYREQFGPKRVENRVQNDQVIASRQGDFFHTVQLHVLDAQSVQGTVMTTMLRAPGTSAVSVDTEKLMPASTSVVSTMQSDDAGKRSVMVVGVNTNSAAANRDHIVSSLRERGFRMLKEDRASGSGALSLVLSSSAEDVAVTISDAGPYRAVLINRTKESK